MVPFRHRLNWSFWLSTVLYCLCLLQNSFCQISNGTSKPSPNSYVPAIFAFGDSLVDTGNNNNLPQTLIKSNLPPYGRNFEDRQATGRFCDGRLAIDFFAEALGIKKNVPAYLDPKLPEADLLTGVSFGSAGSGYDPMTSSNALVRSMNDQLMMLKGYRKTVRSIMGSERAELLLRDSIFIVAAGSTDLAHTYFALPYRRLEHNPKAYTSFMIRRATRFLERLYIVGARRIGVINVPPIGLTPMARTLSGGLTRKIPDYYNDAAKTFNAKLNLEVKFLNSRLPNATFVYIDVYSIMLDIVNDRKKYGLRVSKRGCCGSGLMEAGPLCNPYSLFSNIRKFIFWDSYHPTEAVNNITATQVFKQYFPQFF